MKKNSDIVLLKRKILIRMKITVLTMLLFVMHISASVTVHGQMLTINIRKETLRDVLKEIEQQSSYRFFYNDAFADLNRIIDMNVTKKPLQEIMNDLLAGTNMSYKIMENNLVVITPRIDLQQKKVSGRVTDAQTGEPIPGVNIVVEATTNGTTTSSNGDFGIEVSGTGSVLIFSFIGYITQRIVVGDQEVINVSLSLDVSKIDEVVVVGYGTQKKSDITGSVTSLPQERLAMPSNLNISQALQGAVPGVMIQTASAGAVPDEVIMIRGRNSIKADNSPLIVVDGIPYGGQLVDLNPQDIKSVEILKDASAAAIYGSRGSNGVILVSSKSGQDGKARITYNGSYAVQSFVKLPEVQDGKEFYYRKNEREPGVMTVSEQQIYDAGTWVDWIDLATRKGNSNQHNLSVSGGWENTQYYISGGLTDVKGLGINDDYKRITSRINIETKITDWLTIGTRTNLSYDDMSGVSPFSSTGSEGGLGSDVYHMNPLSKAYDENGKLTIYPWPEDVFGNPLQHILADDKDQKYQVITNNYALITFPFIKGLQYRLNTGITARFYDKGTYYGRDTQIGLSNQGYAETERSNYNNTVLENIVSYNREFGKHSLFFTGVYSYESTKNSSNLLTATGFPHDFLTWYSMAQASQVIPEFQYSATTIISQMLRFNYSYDSRYLLTLTGRRDGYSGFGAKNKWGLFPSVALGWNISNEDFFTLDNIFNQLKIRCSYGLNGNQAVVPYETISRLSEYNYVSGSTTIAGYLPSKLGMDDLGWESTKVFNAGLDFGILGNRISGDLNIYKSNTFDLLLDRTISPVHGITRITQNIGQTENQGFEVSLTSRNIANQDFKWVTSGSVSFNKNKIVSLYGELDDEGNEIDDIANSWFIGHPINVVYYWVWDGVWQLDEAAEAAKWGSQPGFVKIKDLNDDGNIDENDRKIQGQTDPKFLWGMTNSWTYKNLTLSLFVHGVHGVTKRNALMVDDMYGGYRRNTTIKNYWSPDNPSNEWYANNLIAGAMDGISFSGNPENAGFIRIKDVSLTYDIPQKLLDRIKIGSLQVYISGRNLYTFTKWKGLDPELDEQRAIPLQKDFVFGINIKR
jgi:TonB-linked SusC/RagA family outer membrane protein